ncbi:glycosyltransferase family 39 protein [Dyella solisilvae]|uniref:Glycosyltransferase family 39 protein n=1 Tax=Dyella solisilvae TaxID=1920168 RepID=A0A370K550_9GAMM|nr:glycosyltransferase family 39 protein [Dyella solisilvae]RDI97557.1 glycosyltransferase family 39 protein [Dyella solisilvae]
MSFMGHIPRSAVYVWLSLLLLALGMSFQGTRPLWNTDEGRYVDNALQMLDSGNFLTPAYNADHKNFAKPPLTLWAIAATVHVMGSNTWAVRIPSAMAFVLTSLLLCVMGRHLLPDKAWLPGLVYACTAGPFIAGNVVSTDDLLTLCEAIAMCGFFQAAFGPADAQQRLPVLVMWFGFGLAFLTKGTPGLMPLLAIVVFIARRDGMRGIRRYFPWMGLVLFALVGFTWYAVVVLRYPQLLDYYLKYELYGRIFTSAHNRNPQWYGWLVAYVPVFVLGTLPWWPMLVPELKAALSPRNWRRRWHERSPALFLELWLALSLLVFCIARSRLPVYVLPLFMPMALMIALALRDRIDLTSWRQRIMLGIWVVLLLGIKGGAALYGHPLSDDRAIARQLASMVGQTDYSAIAFVEAVESTEQRVEHTPWGIRLYLGKPIYAIAWKHPDAAQKICRLSDRHSSLLLVVDGSIGAATMPAVLAQCPGRQHVELGSLSTARVALLRRVAIAP